MPEVERTVQILCRRSKNNPLYVGEPGVGKTAIAEGLARKIIEGDVPEVLKPATIYSLDMGALLAGTQSAASTCRTSNACAMSWASRSVTAPPKL